MQGIYKHRWRWVADNVGKKSLLTRQKEIQQRQFLLLLLPLLWPIRATWEILRRWLRRNQKILLNLFLLLPLIRQRKLLLLSLTQQMRWFFPLQRRRRWTSMCSLVVWWPPWTLFSLVMVSFLLLSSLNSTKNNNNKKKKLDSCSFIILGFCFLVNI